MTELIEAAARAGQPGRATAALHKVFSKLGISSRRQLRQCLAQLEPRTA